MTKVKNPFLSLDASGSVGESITAQHLSGVKVLRKKPYPAYRYTLPQAYQRWLYEDYAYLWTQQSASTQAAYRSAGSRYHLTAFQYWMKLQLGTMPDIVAAWHLDTQTAAIYLDSGHLGNHITNYGATPGEGRIDGALYFDGVNDEMRIPYNPTFDLIDEFSILAWVRKDVLAVNWFTIVGLGAFYKKGVRIHQEAVDKKIVAEVSIAGVRNQYSLNVGIFPSDWHQVGMTASAITRRLQVIYDGAIYTSGLIDSGYFDVFPDPIQVSDEVKTWCGDIDHVVIYNRIVDLAEVNRWYGRRYPPQ